MSALEHLRAEGVALVDLLKGYTYRKTPPNDPTGWEPPDPPGAPPRTRWRKGSSERKPAPIRDLFDYAKWFPVGGLQVAPTGHQRDRGPAGVMDAYVVQRQGIRSRQRWAIVWVQGRTIQGGTRTAIADPSYGRDSIMDRDALEQAVAWTTRDGALRELGVTPAPRSKRVPAPSTATTAHEATMEGPPRTRGVRSSHAAKLVAAAEASISAPREEFARHVARLDDAEHRARREGWDELAQWIHGQTRRLHVERTERAAWKLLSHRLPSGMEPEGYALKLLDEGRRDDFAMLPESLKTHARQLHDSRTWKTGEHVFTDPYYGHVHVKVHRDERRVAGQVPRRQFIVDVLWGHPQIRGARFDPMADSHREQWMPIGDGTTFAAPGEYIPWRIHQELGSAVPLPPLHPEVTAANIDDWIPYTRKALRALADELRDADHGALVTTYDQRRRAASQAMTDHGGHWMAQVGPRPVPGGVVTRGTRAAHHYAQAASRWGHASSAARSAPDAARDNDAHWLRFAALVQSAEEAERLARAAGDT